MADERIDENPDRRGGSGNTGQGRAAEDRKVSRSSFFSILAASIMETVGHVAGDALDDLAAQLDDAGELWDTEWKRVVKTDEVGEQPVMKVVGGKPVYFVHRGGYQAWEALCPRDGHFLDWVAEQDAFRCVACDALFDVDGRSVPAGEVDAGNEKHDAGEGGEPALKFRPLSVEDGYLLMEIPRR